jgi:hypothetical protein
VTRMRDMASIWRPMRVLGALTVAALAATGLCGQASAESTYVSGGFAASGAGGVGTIGYGWVDGMGAVIGHVTVDHLTRGGTSIEYSPSANFSTPPITKVAVAASTDSADVALVEAFADDLQPTVKLSDGTALTASGYASAGDIALGQRVCHSGHNEVTETMHEVCGAVIAVGPTSKCVAQDGSSTCVVEARTDRSDGWAGGPGDSGAAAYTYKADGTIILVGTFKASSDDGTALFEPTYAAMEMFGGHPLTTLDG